MRALIWGWVAAWTVVLLALNALKLQKGVLFWVVSAGIILIVLYAWFPGYNAWLRGHPKATAIVVGGFLWLILPILGYPIYEDGDLTADAIIGFVILVIWGILVVWSYAGGNSPSRAVAYARQPGVKSLSYPASTRFKIAGVDRATRMDTVWYCFADNEANAKVKAELEGIIVTSVSPE